MQRWDQLLHIESRMRHHALNSYIASGYREVILRPNCTSHLAPLPLLAAHAFWCNPDRMFAHDYAERRLGTFGVIEMLRVRAGL